MAIDGNPLIDQNNNLVAMYVAGVVEEHESVNGRSFSHRHCATLSCLHSLSHFPPPQGRARESHWATMDSLCHRCHALGIRRFFKTNFRRKIEIHRRLSWYDPDTGPCSRLRSWSLKHVFSGFSKLYIFMYIRRPYYTFLCIHLRHRDFRPISFKCGTNIPVCKSIDKFVGQRIQ